MVDVEQRRRVGRRDRATRGEDPSGRGALDRDESAPERRDRAPWVAITSRSESSLSATTLTVMPSASASSDARRAIRASHCSIRPPASIDSRTSEMAPSQRSRRCPSTRSRRSSRSAAFAR